MLFHNINVDTLFDKKKCTLSEQRDFFQTLHSALN